MTLEDWARKGQAIWWLVGAAIVIFAAGWQASLWMNRDLVRYGDPLKISNSYTENGNANLAVQDAASFKTYTYVVSGDSKSNIWVFVKGGK